MSEKKEIKRLRKYAKPYMKAVMDLFEEDQGNPLASAIDFIKKKDYKSAIIQCEMITKQLLNKHYSIKINKMSFNNLIQSINDEFWKKDPLTCVQINHIFYSSNNIECDDFTTAIFTYKNLLQILEKVKPEIPSKMDIDEELKFIQKKLSVDFFRKSDGQKMNYKESADQLFVDENNNPLNDALDDSKKKNQKYRNCVGNTRKLLEKFLPIMYKKTFGCDYVKKSHNEGLLFGILSDEPFKINNIKHHHTFDSMRVVGNWGMHVNEYPINNKYALFSLTSLYILLRWFYGIDYPEKYSKKKQYTIATPFLILFGILVYIFFPGSEYRKNMIDRDYKKTIEIISEIKQPGINDRLYCHACKMFYVSNYFESIKEKNYQEASTILKKTCCRTDKEQLWLDYCLLNLHKVNEDIIKERIEYFQKQENDIYQSLYKIFRYILYTQNVNHINCFFSYSPQSDDPLDFLENIKSCFK